VRSLQATFETWGSTPLHRIFLFVGTLAALSFAACAHADDTPANWKHKPTEADLKAVWPRDALRKGLGGVAEISCTVTVQGMLRDCVVISEDPPSMYFGMAALAMTPQLLFTPATHDGKPVESRVRFPVRFHGLPGVREARTGSNLMGGMSEPGPGVVGGVQWLTAPDYADVVAAYPEKARVGKVGGNVALNCRFTAEGRLRDCDVISEQPGGYGFGPAARELAKDFAALVDKAHPPRSEISTQIAFTFAPDMLTSPSPVIGRPRWTHVPESLDVAQSFPAAATAAHVSTGHVTLNCMVGPAGRLVDCAVSRQDPPGLDFDRAALALAPQFQLSVWTDEGLPTVGGRVSVPLRYEAPTDAAGKAVAR